MIEPPKKLVVGPSRFRVQEVDLGDELLGITRAADLKILVAPHQHPFVRMDTVLHETLHACITAHGIDAGDHDTEERLIRALTPALLALLRDNPKLVSYLCQSL